MVPGALDLTRARDRFVTRGVLWEVPVEQLRHVSAQGRRSLVPRQGRKGWVGVGSLATDGDARERDPMLRHQIMPPCVRDPSNTAVCNPLAVMET